MENSDLLMDSIISVGLFSDFFCLCTTVTSFHRILRRTSSCIKMSESGCFSHMTGSQNRRRKIIANFITTTQAKSSSFPPLSVFPVTTYEITD